MKHGTIMKIMEWLLILTILVSLAGCANEENADNLKGNSYNLMDSFDSASVAPENDPKTVDLSGKNAAVTDFGVRLFQNGLATEGNTLISPISVLTALAMTANGAEGETLKQMETVLGMKVEDLNTYIQGYMAQLPTEDAGKMNMANSIWFIDEEQVFQVNPDFLQINADYYGADVFEAPFDASTLKEINEWVEEKTDEMIPQILDRMPEDAIMYLINALAFEAEWEDTYYEHQVQEGIFTEEDGTETTAQFMYSEEFQYLEDDLASGFIKYYEDRGYAFAALLPEDGVTVEEYAAALTGEKLNNMLSNPEEITVYAAIPKFESEYSAEMSEILKEMGMPDAFETAKADFSRLGSVSNDLNIVINRVIHKTYIEVNETGTRAGAATAVEMTAEGAIEIEEYETVYLDRPFIYMLIDCQNQIPIFIGATMTMK